MKKIIDNILDFIDTFMVFIIIGILVTMAIVTIWLGVMTSMTKVVEVEEIVAEVTHIDYSVKSTNGGSSDKYILAFISENVSGTIKISPEQYARYEVGEEITIIATTKANHFSQEKTFYEIKKED